MKTSQIFHEPPRADWSTVEAVQKQLVEASESLAGMTEAVAAARQVREFAGDRRKRALALATREFLADESAAAAETRGRASVAYGEALDKQAVELQTAERVIAEHEAARVRWESARSVLSSPPAPPRLSRTSPEPNAGQDVAMPSHEPLIASGACYVGRTIWMTHNFHTIGTNAFCTRCGGMMPKPEKS